MYTNQPGRRVQGTNDKITELPKLSRITPQISLIPALWSESSAFPLAAVKKLAVDIELILVPDSNPRQIVTTGLGDGDDGASLLARSVYAMSQQAADY